MIRREPQPRFVAKKPIATGQLPKELNHGFTQMHTDKKGFSIRVHLCPSVVKCSRNDQRQETNAVLRLRAQNSQGGLAQDPAAHEQAGPQRQRRDRRQGRQHRP